MLYILNIQTYISSKNFKSHSQTYTNKNGNIHKIEALEITQTIKNIDKYKVAVNEYYKI